MSYTQLKNGADPGTEKTRSRFCEHGKISIYIWGIAFGLTKFEPNLTTQFPEFVIKI